LGTDTGDATSVVYAAIFATPFLLEMRDARKQLKRNSKSVFTRKRRWQRMLRKV